MMGKDKGMYDYGEEGHPVITEEGLTKDCMKMPGDEYSKGGKMIKDPNYSKMYDEYGNPRYPEYMHDK